MRPKIEFFRGISNFCQLKNQNFTDLISLEGDFLPAKLSIRARLFWFKENFFSLLEIAVFLGLAYQSQIQKYFRFTAD